MFVNGVLVGSNTDNASFPINVFTNVNFESIGTSNIFFGKTKCIAVWKEALTDAELIINVRLNCQKLEVVAETFIIQVWKTFI